MRNRTQTHPLFTGAVVVIAAITGAALATEGRIGELVSAMTTPQNAAVRATTGPFDADVPLITSRGFTTSLAATGGEVRLVSLIYSHCPGVCPLTVQTVQALERQLSPGELSHLGVVLLSLDSADTPAALSAFAAQHGINSERWLIARTVQAADTEALAERLSIQHRRLSDGSIDHAASIALVDAQGRIVTQTRETDAVDERFAAAVRGTLSGAFHRE